ncbi:MAG: hypothetical protein AB8E15_02665 [Bdellovibrionales bacterium]
MKKNILSLFVSAISMNLFAHGSIELIECHSKDNKTVLRGEAENDKNVFEFKLLMDSKEVWKAKDVKIELSDTVVGSKVMENIKFSSAKNSAHIQVHEVYAREIRNGSGSISFLNPSIKADMICYAVY